MNLENQFCPDLNILTRLLWNIFATLLIIISLFALLIVWSCTLHFFFVSALLLVRMLTNLVVFITTLFVNFCVTFWHLNLLALFFIFFLIFMNIIFMLFLTFLVFLFLCIINIEFLKLKYIKNLLELKTFT